MHQHHHDSLFRFHRRLANLRILEIDAIRHGYLESRNSIVVVVSDADFWHELRTRHPQHAYSTLAPDCLTTFPHTTTQL